MTQHVPDWNEIAARLVNGTLEDHLTPLERFVYDYEPAGLVDAEQFRDALAEVLTYASECHSDDWQP